MTLIGTQTTYAQRPAAVPSKEPAAFARRSPPRTPKRPGLPGVPAFCPRWLCAAALCWLSAVPALGQSLSVTVSGVGANAGTLTLANAGSSTFQSYKSFSNPYRDCQRLSSAVTTIS